MPNLHELTPRQIVAELDRHIVGQSAAKRAVAIALRNRFRRSRLPAQLRDEVVPKNIVMIGPTGVGKTEIARRLAKLAGAPFVKVEATKFTEVGYVGRDVDSMVRDLADVAVQLVKAEATERMQEPARERAEERILDLLSPGAAPSPPPRPPPGFPFPFPMPGMPGMPPPPPPPDVDARPPSAEQSESRRKLRQELREGQLEARMVEIDVREKQGGTLQVFSNQGLEELGMNLQELFGRGGKTKKRKVSVAEARFLLAAEEAERLLDMDAIVKEAIHRAENLGIIFIDEIDKVAGKGGANGPDVSRSGVQRDLLPIVEGSTITTKYGPLRTDHVLFIAAGAFHMTKVADLIPELQGRFPIRVELEPLRREDLARILREPEGSLVKQAIALLATEDVTLEFSDDAIDAIADVAHRANERHENIGARRLHTVLEKLLEELSFDADQQRGTTVRIDRATVATRLEPLLGEQDLRNYIL